MNLHDIIIDRSAAQKILRIASMRDELKPLGYSVVSSTYLASLIGQEKRKALEEA